MQTASITLATLTGQAATIASGGPQLLIQAKPLGSDGLPSGVPVRLASSDTGVAKVTTTEQDGAAPAGVIGIAPGSAVITATPIDNSAVSATLAVTVT